MLRIEITDRCNLRCNYCPRSLGIDGKNGDMDFETFKKIVDYCAKKGVEIYAFIGIGEPTLYPNLVEAVAYVKNQVPNATIGFNTNGIRLSYELGRELSVAGLTRITISINATSKEQYKRLNGLDIYDKVVKNTQDFLRAVNESEKRVKVLLNVMCGRVNCKEQVEAFKSFWKPFLGECGAIGEVELGNWGGLIDAEKLIENEITARGEEITRTPQKLLNLETTKENDIFCKRYPCLLLLEAYNIAGNGEALPCCSLPSSSLGDLKLGNIADQSLEEIYYGQKSKELWRKNLNCELYRLSPCKECSGWSWHANVWWRNPFYPLFGTKWF
ncbi:MAG: radical SAM protein [Helicobacteraceae bacterium]|nr:radical SAM protein [Helicobacteraceae bacterium]